MSNDNIGNQTFKINGIAHRRSVYEMIFARLRELGILTDSGEMEHGFMKFESKGLMPLNVDFLCNGSNGTFTISLAHNGIQNGDVMADPDMEVKVYPSRKEAEALSFRNDYIGVYQVVYPAPGQYYPKLKKEHNRFLNNWLKNMVEVQKYTIAETEAF